MTAHPTPCAVVWQTRPDLRPVPAHGTALRPAAPRYEQRLRSSLSLPGRERTTPCLARAYVDLTCRTWHVPREVRADAALITSELTTNAVIHGSARIVIVTVLLSPTYLWVVVDEKGRAAGVPRPRGPVEPRTAGDDAEDGRGLHLVEALAARYQVTGSSDGTRAWACLALPSRRQLADARPTDHSPTQDGTKPPHPEDTDDVPRSHP